MPSPESSNRFTPFISRSFRSHRTLTAPSGTNENNTAFDRSSLAQLFLRRSSSSLSAEGRTRPAQRRQLSTSTLSNTQYRLGALTTSDSLNPARNGRYYDDYNLNSITAGDRLQLTLSSPDFDAYLQLINRQTGQVIARNNDLNSDTSNARLTFTAQAGVSYTLRVTTYDSDETGNYHLAARELAPDPVTIRNFNFSYGYGLVDAAAAVGAAVGRNPFGDVANRNGWALDMVKAPEVWRQGHTGRNIVVAVLDTGVDYRHEDLRNNIWRNPGEISGNGIDDDGNGFVDDVRGWTFVDRDNNSPMDRDGHGTHIAGTIAAVKNDRGITGVAYNAKIMPVKVIDGDDDASFSRFDRNVADGIRYAVNNGAHVINMSLGNYLGEPHMSRTYSALEYARRRGVVVVIASGNEAEEGATEPIEPAVFARNDLAVAVGAVDRNRTVASFSNPAGSRRMDYVVAPGVSIRSTVPRNRYDAEDGTSMAAPHVAGVVALMLSANPNLTPAQVQTILRNTAQRSVRLA